MQNITPLQGTHVNHALLLELEISNNVGVKTTYYFSNAYKAIVYNSNTYQPMATFLSIGNIQSDITGTNDEISIALSGIDPTLIAFVLDDTQYRIKGSPIRMRRAFFDEATHELLANQVYLRYSGYVTNYGISEEYDADQGTATNTITVTCASVHSILENRTSGRRTNPKDYQVQYAETYITSAITTDPSMNLVPSLHNSSFDFGKPYKPPVGGVRGGGGGRGRGFEEFNVNEN